MTVLHRLRRLANKFGIDVERYPEGSLRSRIVALDHFQIDTILDVGANDGGYASQLRELGFQGKIISFEPISTVFQKLERKSRYDKKWFSENIALGDEDATTFINISQNSVSSSLLEILPLHSDTSPESKFVRKEKISVRKLDSVFHKYYVEGERVLLKIDTQGFEKKVLQGAEKSLKLISGVQLEMSLMPLYKGTPLFKEMIEYMDERGFYLYNIENGFVNRKNGQQLQIDGTFYRKGVF